MNCIQVPIGKFRLLKQRDLKAYSKEYDAVEVVGEDGVVSIRVVLKPADQIKARAR